MKTKTIVSAISVLLTAFPLSLLASDSSPSNHLETSAKDNTIVVTANRFEQAINDVISDIIVIDRSEIEKKQPQSLVDLLKNVSGVDFAQTGGHGQDSSIFVRGANSNQVLVLIDGVRVGSATLGSKAPSTIPVAHIERIEIVKGPRAALWGSDAIGGVIQIFTREYNAGEYRASLSVGSNNTTDIDLAVGFGDDIFNNTIVYNNKSSDGFDVRDDNEFDEDGYENESVSIRGEYNFSEKNQLNWVVQSDRGEADFDSPWSTDNTNEYTNHHFNIGYVVVSDRWTQQINLAGSRDAISGFETRRQQANYQFATQVNQQFSLSGGLDWLEDDISKTVTNFPQETRDTLSFYLAGNYITEQWIVDLAIRNDDVESVANEVTSNFGLGYRVDGNHLISFNYGEGFKAPTFNDLYFPFGGNPDLKFETSTNQELIYKGRFGNSRLVLAIYESEIDNLIQWIPDSNGAFSPQNVGKVDISGVDFTYQVQVGDYSHKVTADNINARDALTNQRLIRRAKNHFGYELGYASERLDWFAQLEYVGKRPDTDFSTFSSVELDSFVRVNIGLGYQVNDQVKLQLKVNDLGDEAPVIVSGFNPIEREFYLNVSYQAN